MRRKGNANGAHLLSLMKTGGLHGLVVKSAPKADRSHLVDRTTETELHRHYELI